MKKIAFVLSVAGMVASLAACTEKEEEKTPAAPTVAITVTEGKITSTSFEFTITPANAEKCSYMVIDAAENIPTESEILANGTATDADKASTITADELKSATKYTVVAVVSSSDGQTTSAQQEVTTTEAPVVEVVLNRGTARFYGTRNIGLTLRGEDSGIDYEISLDLYDDSYQSTGYLTVGTYTVSAGTEDRAMNQEYSYLQKDNDQYKFVSGTLEVAIVDNAYSLKLNVELDNDGGNFVGTFNGTIDDMPIVTETPAVVLDRGTAKVYGTRNIGLTLRGEDSGIDYEISLDLYDDSYQSTGYLTAGTYTVSAGTEDRAMNQEYSYLQKDNDQYKFVSGTLEVAIVDNAYSLKLNVELNNDGGNFVGTFDGTFEDMPIE